MARSSPAEGWPEDWAAAVRRLREGAAALGRWWPSVSWNDLPVGAGGAALGLLRAEAPVRDQLLILVAGLHGVEGPAGAAVIDQFFRTQAGSLDHRRVSVWVLFGPNPTGWRDGRKTNHDNVDLNRSFLVDRAAPQPENPAYEAFRAFLEPRRPRSLAADLASLVRFAARGDLPRLEGAVTLGQYASPRGLYFGGTAEPEATTRLKALFDEALDGWAGVTVLDLHSGYGPVNTLAVVNSRYEPVPPAEWSRRLDGALVQAADGASFYAIHGDMTDWLTLRHRHRAPEKAFWAASLEFGTWGTSLPAQIRSLRATIHENAAYWGGSGGQRRRWTRELRALYAPASARWRSAVLDQGGRVLTAVLRDRGLGLRSGER